MQDKLFDHRKAERLHLHLPCRYTFERPEGRAEGVAVTSEVSGGGVGFVLADGVAPGTACQVALTLPERGVVAFAGHVIWCQPRSNGQRNEFDIGVAFTVSRTNHREAFESYCQFIASHLVLRYTE